MTRKLNKEISVAVNQDIKDLIIKKAKHTGQTQQRVVRMILSEYFSIEIEAKDRSKLDAAIYKSWSNGCPPLRQIADQYNVSKSYVSGVISKYLRTLNTQRK